MGDLKTLQQVRREHISQVLRNTGGEIDLAAKVLDITPAALKRLIRQLGLSSQEAKGDREAE